MDYTPELAKALKELERITGIAMQIPVEDEEACSQALIQVQLLCSAYKEKYDRNHFFYNLLTGQVSSYDIPAAAKRFHLDPEEDRVLYLICTRTQIDETISEILKNIFPSQRKTWLIPVDDHMLAVLYPLKKRRSSSEIAQTANMILDTINMEALLQADVAYSAGMNHLSQLPAAYQETLLTLKVGQLFSPEDRIYPYDRQGIGQLIYQLPVPICEKFLGETFGEEFRNNYNEDIQNTVRHFLKNNLNIAETARQLHMHRNSLIYRLEQIEKSTGLDLRRLEDALTFKIASMVYIYLQHLT